MLSLARACAGVAQAAMCGSHAHHTCERAALIHAPPLWSGGRVIIHTLPTLWEGGIASHATPLRWVGGMLCSKRWDAGRVGRSRWSCNQHVITIWSSMGRYQWAEIAISSGRDCNLEIRGGLDTSSMSGLVRECMRRGTHAAERP